MVIRRPDELPIGVSFRVVATQHEPFTPVLIKEHAEVKHTYSPIGDPIS